MMSEVQQHYAFEVTDEDAGERLDRFLARQLPAIQPVPTQDTGSRKATPDKTGAR